MFSGLITEKNNIAIILLIVSSAFLRLYRIDAHTEFLGDQGRTGIEVYRLWIEGKLPLLGPQVLSGQHLGPLFYYLFGPAFILTHFNPLAPAVFMAFLGVGSVLILFYICKNLFGSLIGFFIALLYAVSPVLIRESRTLWDPNPIPFFVLLYIFSLYKIFTERKFQYFLLLGATVAALVQFHYPNLFFVPLSFLFWIIVLVTKKKNEQVLNMFVWGLSAVASFLTLLLPFLIYEFQHQFENIRGVLLVFVSSNTTGFITPPFYKLMIDFSSRIFKNVIPIENSDHLLFVQGILIILPLFILIKEQKKKIKIDAFISSSFWLLFFAVWYEVGLFSISLFKGVVHNHYLNFLVPLPFFFFAIFLYYIKKIVPHQIVVLALVGLVTWNALSIDTFSQPLNDIERTKKITEYIVSHNQPLSFTLISSRSFSDLHHRYFYTIENRDIKKITDTNYSLLFLVCEKQPCPTNKTMKKTPEIQTMCYDYHCEEEYPKINLKNFLFVGSKNVFDSKVFQFERKKIK